MLLAVVFLSLPSSGWSLNDVDNWNTNTNCSAHLVQYYNNINLAHMAKNHNFKRSLVFEQSLRK